MLAKPQVERSHARLLARISLGQSRQVADAAQSQLLGQHPAWTGHSRDATRSDENPSIDHSITSSARSIVRPFTSNKFTGAAITGSTEQSALGRR